MKKHFWLFFSILIFSCGFSPIQENRLIVVFTFDDCHESIYETAFPLMEEYGYQGSNIVNSCVVGSIAHYGWEELGLMSQAGWEVVSHTMHHANLTEISWQEAEEEILGDIENLNQQGYEPQSFALPCGAVNQQIRQLLWREFKNIRHSADTTNYFPVDRKSVGYFPMQSTYSASEMISRLQRAEYNGECLVILGFHRILPQVSNAVDNCTPEDFVQILEYVKRQGYEVLTMQEGLERSSN